jgi:hypothetical protein
MLAVALVALAALARPDGRHPSDDPTASDPDATGPLPSGRTPLGRTPLGRRFVSHRPHAEPDDRDWASRYADEVAVAAERAVATAARRRSEWEHSQTAVDTTWQAFDDADRAARRAAAAVAFPVPQARRTPAEFADRERFLHRAAAAACRRHELSIGDLNDVIAHRNGWDPRRHPVEQEAVLRRAIRDRLYDAYREAVGRERTAWQTAEVAAAALSSLREEAFAARARVGERVRTPGEQWWAEQWTTDPAAQATQPIALPTPSQHIPAQHIPAQHTPALGAPQLATR